MSKGLTIDEYLAFAQVPNNKANEMTLYLLASQCRLHAAVITCDRVFYTYTIPLSEADPNDCKIVLAYLGQGTFRQFKWHPVSPTQEPKPAKHAIYHFQDCSGMPRKGDESTTWRKPQKARVNVMTEKPAGTGMPKNVPPEEPDSMPKKPRRK